MEHRLGFARQQVKSSSTVSSDTVEALSDRTTYEAGGGSRRGSARLGRGSGADWGSRQSHITFGDLERDHAQMKDELLKAFERVLDSSAFILGEEVERFEEEFAAYCGTSHCVGTASGTAALTLALLAAGIGPGDEVIVPAHTYIASALAVVHAGAIPVVADVEDGTGLLDVDSAEAAIGERTAAVVAVHLYGQVCEADPLHRLAERHGLLLLEDAAQAHGAVDAFATRGLPGRGSRLQLLSEQESGRAR